MTKRVEWRQKLWGVKFSAPRSVDMLLGESWHSPRPGYNGEPLRPLLFTTRQAAREWCVEKRSQYAGRYDVCAQWKFTPVRVLSLVKEAK